VRQCLVPAHFIMVFVGVQFWFSLYALSLKISISKNVRISSTERRQCHRFYGKR
jgi:hypothetical protein